MPGSTGSSYSEPFSKADADSLIRAYQDQYCKTVSFFAEADKVARYISDTNCEYIQIVFGKNSKGEVTLVIGASKGDKHVYPQQGEFADKVLENIKPGGDPLLPGDYFE